MFSGITRNYFEDKNVIELSYEAYSDMTYSEFEKINLEIRQKWNVSKVLIVHRLGIVKVSECSILILISSNHRKDALNSVEYAINRLKEIAPIWKKEIYSSDNENVWKSNKEFLNSNHS